MRTIHEISTELPVIDQVDVLVVGGGPAGVAAALAAARRGAKTCIVEQFNCLGGVATSGGHNHISQYNAWNDRSQHIVGGIADEVRLRMLARGFATYDGSCFDFHVEGLKLLLDEMMAEAGVQVRYYTFYAGTLKEGDAVVGGIIQSKSGRQAILARRIVDATGDGDTAFHAGAAFEQGRPQDGRCQPTTLMFTIGGVDWPPVEAWRSSYQMREVWLKAQVDGIMEPFQDQIMGFWHTDVLPDQVGVNMTHMVGIDTTDAGDLTRATIEGRRQAFHLVEVFRKVVPGMEKCYLISTAPSLGLRESRRIRGMVTITADDLMQQRAWPDAIGYGSFFIDIHNPAGPGMSGQTWRPPAGFHYQIPYRALVPERVDNLLVAGRCISADHVALGSLRIMVTCTVMGEAAGAAAILSLHEEVAPRELDAALLRDQLRRGGAIMDESDIRQVTPPQISNAIIKQQREDRMNARERLFAALSGEPTDHVPIWLLFPYHRTGYYGDVRDEPSYRPVFEASKQYAIMLDRRNPRVSLFAPEVRQWHEAWTEGDDRIEREFLEYQGRRLYSEIRRHSWGTDIKRLLCTEDDLEFYCSLPLNTDPDAITAQLHAQLPTYLQERAEFPEEYGAMMLDLGEPVGALYGVSKLEEYAVWSLTHSDLIADSFDRVMVQKRLVYKYCLDRKLADVYFLVGSELASPPLVSRKTFRRWIVPYAHELIELIHSHGCKVIQHYHGQIKLILPDFLEMGPDGLHTIEAPPIGNCTFSEAFDIVGDRIALIGNIQYDEFRALTPDEMRQAVIAVLDECRGKRLILSPSAGPYEESISEEMVENYLVFMKTAWEYRS